MVKTELSLGFLVSFLLLIGIDDRKFLLSCEQYVPVRITLHVLRCIPLREVVHGEDGIIGFFFFFSNLASMICFEVVTVTCD